MRNVEVETGVLLSSFPHKKSGNKHIPPVEKLGFKKHKKAYFTLEVLPLKKMGNNGLKNLKKPEIQNLLKPLIKNLVKPYIEILTFTDFYQQSRQAGKWGLLPW